MIAKLNILYDKFLPLLADYSDTYAGYQAYEDVQPDQARKDRLFELAEKIAGYQNAVVASMAANVIYNDFQPLTTAVSDLATEFSDHPVGRFSEVLMIIKIIDVIEKEVSGSGHPLDLTVELDDQIFCLEEIVRPMQRSNFLSEDPAAIENSIVLFNLSDLNELQNFIESALFGMDLLFHLLEKLGHATAPLIEGQFVLIRRAQQGQAEAVFSCAALHLVKAGKLVHEPVNYTGIPSVSASRKILSDQKFQQFSDSLMILSEYNSQQDILDKYLRIYHLIEHFMFRKPIVELERRRNNLPFSIRDFRSLYKSVEQSEPDAIKALLKEVMKREIEPNVTFTDKMFVDWQALSGHIIDINQLNRLFELMLINGKNPFSYAAITAMTLPDIFHKLVYAFRNSVVHNKATEFHLNHETMTIHHETGNVAQLVIENFLLPSLEQISFYLIIENNDLVWYHNPHLTLFTV
ncbi:hypothetical protein [Pedobacter psychroterrae]|uniref:Uncharacterized protein n=1 Tax=Pedobacter psychroterrae TaxID=2530453 RepID=A0A4R0NTF2_9SPHI|nr:hypothetical protein [Pedobacter psychroterrae]TCD03203.1 hypothetical protein EZ437_04315 [Pedobacter psychroterrae]